MKSSLGVLILHGFTSGRATVEAIVPKAEALGLPWRLPQLRGHWTKPEDLTGVTYADWLADAGAALTELQGVAERVSIVALSMGSVVALNLAAERPSDVDSLAVLVPALRFVNPFSRVSWLLARFVHMWPHDTAPAFTDKSLLPRAAANYNQFPMAAFASLCQAGPRVEGLLPKITAPLLVLGARSDRVVQPRCAQIAFEHAGSIEKELVWFERSGHELLLDCESDAAAERVGLFLWQRLEAGSALRSLDSGQ